MSLPFRAGGFRRSFSVIASGAAAALAFVMAAAAMGSESPSLATPQPVRVRIHWVDGDRGFFGDGKAVAVVGDSLFLSRLLVWREGSDPTTGDVGRIGVYLPNLDRIQVSRGAHRHGGQGALIGGVIGVALGALAFQSYTSAFPGPSNSNAGGLTVIGGGAFGALLGAGIGAAIRTEKWEPVDPDELGRLLEGGSATSSNHR